MKWGGSKLRGRGLLNKIRFCVMDAEFLSVGVHRLLPAKRADWIDVLALETLRLKGACRQLERDSELVGARLGRRRTSLGHSLACGGSDTGQVVSGPFG
jgi:hypothetical protein